MTQSGDLQNYDLLQLLRLLADAGKTGLLRVRRPGSQAGGQFQLWLREGKVVGVRLGPVAGELALAVLLNDPQGTFSFEDGVLMPTDLVPAEAAQEPRSLNALAYAALKNLPAQPLPFSGPVKLTGERLKSHELDDLPLSPAEREALTRLQQRPLGELTSDPEASALAWRLYRLDLLRERRSRTARLVVTLNRAKAHVALIDEVILQRWETDTGVRPGEIIVRDERERTYTMPVQGQPGLNAQLLLSPPLLLQTGLSVGQSLLAKPL